MIPLEVQMSLQADIDGASREERQTLRAEANKAIDHLRPAMRAGTATREQQYAVNLAIEMITRVDCTELGKGWWYRTRTRPRIMAQVLGLRK